METPLHAGTMAPTDRIRQLRMERFLTLEELSQASGIHFNTLWRMEKGYPATVRTYRKLAKALGVDPSELAQL